jgi:hypothetical protein
VAAAMVAAAATAVAGMAVEAAAATDVVFMKVVSYKWSYESGLGVRGANSFYACAAVTLEPF